MSKRPWPAAAAIVAGLAGCGERELPADPELGCRDRLVTVNHARGFLAAHPEHVVICEGYSLVIEIVPPVGKDEASTAPAGERAPDWLRVSQPERGGIEIKVPETGASGTYKYNITIKDVGTLDPRFTVKRR